MQSFMKVQLVFAALLIAVTASRTDTVTIHITATCSLYKDFDLTAQAIEKDSWGDDHAEIDDFQCHNTTCIMDLKYRDDDDGFWDGEYELQVKVTHDCTVGRVRQEYKIENPDQWRGYFIAPVGKDSELSVSFKA